MITGYNTDVRHVEMVLHVQTEDKGRDNPFIESVIYVAGRVLAAKRSGYAELLAEGKGDAEISQRMDHQHRTIVAAIRAGRFDAKLEELKRGSPATGKTAAHATDAVPAPDPVDGSTMIRTAEAALAGPPAVDEEIEVEEIAVADEGPTLDQVILDYLSTEAEHDQLILVVDGQEELVPGRSNQLTLRAYSSKSGLPIAGVQVAVKMLSTVADPRTLLVAETDDLGSLEMQLDLPPVSRGSAALIISGSSALGRAEIKQLL
ncbi:MAG: hypothetical protein AB7G12_02550 [Thermoanaerobaculia bacterium]